MGASTNSCQFVKLSDHVYVDLGVVIGFRLQPDTNMLSIGVSSEPEKTKKPMVCSVSTTHGTMGIFGDDAELAFNRLCELLT